MSLPKRFCEKPRKQDVYSKLDWQNHPSHAPPYGFGPPDDVCSKALSDAESGKDGPQKSKAFVGVPLPVLPLSIIASFSAPLRREGWPAAGYFCQITGGKSRRLWASRLDVRLSAPSLRASAADRDEDIVRRRRGAGSGGARSRGFGKETGARGGSGFSRAKQERPEQFPQMQAVFTCNRCETRQSKVFTRMAYEQGVVVVKCTGCGVQHILADNLGYFQDMTGSRAVNVEDLLRAKGEKVDNRLSPAGIGELKLADPLEREDGTIEVRPDAA